MFKGDQLKWQSARFAFERHRDRYPHSPISFSLQLFSLPIATQVCCAKQKRLEKRKSVQGGLAQVVERSIRIREAPGTITRILQLVFLYNYFRCQLQHKFFVPNRKGWRIEQICKRDQLKWQNARFAFDRHRDGDPDTPIGYSLQLFSLPISTQVFCAKQKSLENRKNVQGRLAQVVEGSIRIREAPGSIPGFSNQFFFTIIFVANCNTSFLCQTEKVGEQNKYARGISSSGRALDSHSIGTGMETRILQLVILYNNFHCQFQRKFFVPNRKGWRIENMSKGDQLKWQSARIRIREAPGLIPGFSNYFFFTIIFVANCNTSFLCQTEKVGKQKICPRGLAQVVERSIRIREAPGSIPGFSNQFFFTIIFVTNCNTSFLCQTEKVGEQKKCTRGISSSGRALDSHSRGTGIDTQILQLVFLYNYFRCQLQHNFFVPNIKVWRIEKMCKGDQLKWQSARFAFGRHRDRDTDTPNWLFFTIIFIANFNASLLCQTEKVEEQKQYPKGDQLKWQSAGFAFERHRDRDTDTPIGYSLQLFSLPISTQVCCAKQKSLEKRNKLQEGLAQVVQRSIRILDAPGSRHG